MGLMVGRTITRTEQIGDDPHKQELTLDNGIKVVVLVGDEALPPRKITIPPNAIAKNIWDFKLGNKVVVNNRCGTQKLRGATGEVVKLAQTRVHVKLDENPRIGEKWSGQIATCTPAMLDLLEK